VELDPSKSNILKNILPRVNALGFEIEEFGNHTFIIHGTPSGLDNGVDIESLVEQLISQYVNNLEFELGLEENLARSMAVSSGVKKGKKLEKSEMTALIDLLFACKMPYKSPSGKNCFIMFELEEMVKRFNQQ
jgi:DNA mismatch repair protein MutL